MSALAPLIVATWLGASPSWWISASRRWGRTCRAAYSLLPLPPLCCLPDTAATLRGNIPSPALPLWRVGGRGTVQRSRHRPQGTATRVCQRGHVIGGRYPPKLAKKEFHLPRRSTTASRGKLSSWGAPPAAGHACGNIFVWPCPGCLRLLGASPAPARCVPDGSVCFGQDFVKMFSVPLVAVPGFLRCFGRWVKVWSHASPRVCCAGGC